MPSRSLLTKDTTKLSFDLFTPLSIAIIIIIIGITYSPVIHSDYIWDDITLFLDRVVLSQSPLHWKTIATPVLQDTSYFRPWVFLTFWLEFNTWGRDPVLSHFINILLHTLNSIVVFLISNHLYQKNNDNQFPILVLLTSLMYALHPSLIEVAAWVSGRFDLLATFFTLVGCYILIKNPADTVSRAASLGLIFFLALGSKEIGIIMTPALLILGYCTQTTKISEKITLKNYFYANKWLIISLILSFSVYFILRRLSMGESYHKSMSLEYIHSSWLEQGLPLKALLFYIKQAFLPFFSISPIHPIRSATSVIASGIAGVMLVLLCYAIAFWKFYRKCSALTAGILLFLLSIFPVLYFVPATFGDNIGCDRFLTLPLAFLSIGLSSLSFKYLRSTLIKSATILFFTCWTLLAALTVKSLLPFWSNELNFWHWIYLSHPTLIVGKTNYFSELLNRKEYALLDKELQAIKTKNGSLELYDAYIYSVMLLTQGDPASYAVLQQVAAKLDTLNINPTTSDFESRYPLSKAQIGSIYYNLALANFRYNPDWHTAYGSNQKARSFYSPLESTPLYIQHMMFLLADDNQKEAERILSTIDTVHYFNANATFKDAKMLLEEFCRKQQTPQECSLRIQQFWSVHQLPR